MAVLETGITRQPRIMPRRITSSKSKSFATRSRIAPDFALGRMMATWARVLARTASATGRRSAV